MYFSNDKGDRRNGEFQARSTARNRFREQEPRSFQSRTKARDTSNQATRVDERQRKENKVAERDPRTEFFEESLGPAHFLDNQDRGSREKLLHHSKLAIARGTIESEERASVPTSKPKGRKLPGRPRSHEASEGGRAK